MIFSICTGRFANDCKTHTVVCEPCEIENIAVAIARGEQTNYAFPIACVVKNGKGVSFNDYDIKIWDCM